MSRCETHHGKTKPEHFSTEWGSLPGGVGHIMACSFGLHRTQGMFTGGRKGEERERFLWFGEEQVWENRRKIRCWSHVNSFLVSIVVWPCPMLDQCCLCYSAIKFLYNSFPG